MIDVKKHLQEFGIMYIDWKPDNIGIGDGHLKLFDFDVSGLVDPKNPGKWILSPPEWAAYKDALKVGKKTPIEIDDYSFALGFDFD